MSRPEVFIQNEQSLLLRWKKRGKRDVQQIIPSAKQQLEKKFQEYIVEMVIGYGELAVYLKPSVTTITFAQELSQMNFSEKEKSHAALPRKITLPVCYKGEFALDLAEIVREKKLSVTEIIRLHTAPIYPVSFIGFLPGFPYLEGLNEKLATPRKETPRPKILKGSVGIGGSHTGIYSQNSPGGWSIIGRTPIDLFNVNSNPPALLQAGDRVKFQSISEKEFSHISDKLKTGDYTLKIETTYD